MAVGHALWGAFGLALSKVFDPARNVGAGVHVHHNRWKLVEKEGVLQYIAHLCPRHCVELAKGDGEPAEHLVNILVRVPHRQVRDDDAVEHAVVDKEVQKNVQICPLVLLCRVVQLQEKHWRQLSLRCHDVLHNSPNDLDRGVVALTNVCRQSERVGSSPVCKCAIHVKFLLLDRVHGVRSFVKMGQLLVRLVSAVDDEAKIRLRRTLCTALVGVVGAPFKLDFPEVTILVALEIFPLLRVFFCFFFQFEVTARSAFGERDPPPNNVRSHLDVVHPNSMKSADCRDLFGLGLCCVLRAKQAVPIATELSEGFAGLHRLHLD